MPNDVRGIKRRRSAKTQPAADLDAFIAGAKDASDDVMEGALRALSPEEEVEREPVKVFNLRLSPILHDKLESVSQATGKSMHEVALTLLVPGLEKAYERYVEK